MNNLQLFNNPDFEEIRALELDGQPWFVGKDVAQALGYSNVRDAINRHVDPEDKGVVKHDTPGGTQKMTIINESGLYSLVLSSKLPGAKQFKRWVTSEVLPSIPQERRLHQRPGNHVAGRTHGQSADGSRKDPGGTGKADFRPHRGKPDPPTQSGLL